ncbi:MAG: replication initiator protein A, partial [Defluviitaleaceae bacterium]|nr:replication initiator protein A [Defluviitaleaceae bacterium]
YTSENLKAVVDKFYQMPRFLDTSDFSELSIHAKMLYVYLLDRLKLSLSSNWFDEENGQVYMYYKREEMQKALKLTAKTVKKVVDELKSHDLMFEKVQGINLPNRIFLYAPLEENNAGEYTPDVRSLHVRIPNCSHGQGNSPPPGRENFQPRTGKNSTSGHGIIPTPEGEIFPPIKNESNKNEKIQNENTENEGSKTTAAPVPEAAAADPPEVATPAPLSAPFAEIMQLYNQICHMLRPIVSINGKRRSQISDRFKEYGIGGIKTLFEITAQSDFLCGGGERGWKADFDWLIDANNCQKVFEGKYDNDQTSTRPLPHSDTGQGYFFVTTPSGVIEMPISAPAETAEARAAPDFPALCAPNPARAARPSQFPNYRNKNGVNTMAVLQQMLAAEENHREDVAV